MHQSTAVTSRHVNELLISFDVISKMSIPSKKYEVENMGAKKRAAREKSTLHRTRRAIKSIPLIQGKQNSLSGRKVRSDLTFLHKSTSSPRETSQ